MLPQYEAAMKHRAIYTHADVAVVPQVAVEAVATPALLVTPPATDAEEEAPKPFYFMPVELAPVSTKHRKHGADAGKYMGRGGTS